MNLNEDFREREAYPRNDESKEENASMHRPLGDDVSYNLFVTLEDLTGTRGTDWSWWFALSARLSKIRRAKSQSEISIKRKQIRHCSNDSKRCEGMRGNLPTNPLSRLNVLRQRE